MDSGVVERSIACGTDKKSMQNFVWKLQERGKLADLVANRENNIKINFKN